jgi:hypothetical protein
MTKKMTEGTCENGEDCVGYEHDNILYWDYKEKEYCEHCLPAELLRDWFDGELVCQEPCYRYKRKNSRCESYLCGNWKENK